MTGRGEGVLFFEDIRNDEFCGWKLFTEAGVLGLCIGRGSVVSDGAGCSNMPIKDVVGGIGVVSNSGSKPDLALCDEGGLRSRPESVRTDLSTEADDWSPVRLGLIDADLEAARVAAIKE